MDINTLPKDLKLSSSSRIQAFQYLTQSDIQRGKINLEKNTISFLRTGVKEVIGDDKTVRIDREKFVVMKSGNCLMTEKISASDKFYKSILLFFSDDVIIDFLERNDLYQKSKKNQKSFYVFAYDSFVHHFVDGIEKIIRLPVALQEKMLVSKFEEIMLYLTHQHGAEFLNVLIQQIGHSEQRLTHIVENNKHIKLSLQELAFLSNMSVSTFKREFYKLYQETPMKWFTESRLTHIALLLKTNNNRPSELFKEAGYDNLSNFIQAFKKKFGVTPKQYQQK